MIPAEYFMLDRKMRTGEYNKPVAKDIALSTEDKNVSAQTESKDTLAPKHCDKSKLVQRKLLRQA